MPDKTKLVKACISNIVVYCPKCDALMLAQGDQRLMCTDPNCKSYGIVYERPSIFLKPVVS